MESINHKGHQYTLVKDFSDDKTHRAMFNELAKQVYGFDFEAWYQTGCWNKKYIPYALIEGNEMVANVSISIIDFLLEGKKRTFIQIGSVMTRLNKRHQGLNRLLLERVLRDWRGKTDLIYLFANDTVLDFYPKFGFKQIDQWQYSKPLNTLGVNNTKYKVTKLDMSLPENKRRLFNKINQSMPLSKFSMIQNAPLVMFYYTVFVFQNVYEIDDLDALVIADYKNDVLYLQDVYSQHKVALDEVINALSKHTVKKVVLGFIPQDSHSYNLSVLVPDDVLFVLDDVHEIFERNKLMFPVMSHA